LTEIIRTDAPRRSATASLALAGLIVGVVWFSILSVVIALQVLGGFEDGQADTYMAVFLGMVFLLLTVALDVYRKEFMPDELIHKIRRPKIVPPRAFR
jgi:threonine/homoserine/homoserine lactone efflux protein